MAYNFPSNPTLDQTYTFNDFTWKWNGRYWQILTNTAFIGATGATGAGATGATGVSGAPGSPGTAGSPGTPGAAGADGSTGATGPQGPSGAPGTNLASATEAFTRTFTGTGSQTDFDLQANIAHSSQLVTFVDGIYQVPDTNFTSNTSWIKFVGAPAANAEIIVQSVANTFGATGPQGATGLTGSPGGATGATGPTGATGTSGTPGTPGTSANVVVSDEGTVLTTAVTSLNFVGSAVTASATGSNVTITITGTGGGGTGYTLTFGNIAPANPQVGDRWINSDDLIELVYVNDGDNTFWMEPAGGSGGGGGGANFTYGNTAPVGPAIGDRWMDSDNLKEFVYIYDGDSYAWVEPSIDAGLIGATGATGPQGATGAGSTGATGTQGNIGPVGATGIQGNIGPVGATGPAGTSANIAVYDEGSLVTGTVTGLNFVGAGITANTVSGNVQITVTATGTGSGGGFQYANTAPASPQTGDRWLDSDSMIEYVYVNDGDSSQWVEPITRAFSTNLTSVSTHVIPDSNVSYDLGTSSLRWRDLYLSGNSIILGAATLSSTGSAVNLPAGSTVGGQNIPSSGDVATGGGPKITNVQVTNNSWTVIDDTAVDTAGGYVKITGTNFVTGCQVVAGTTTASAVSFVSSTELRVQFGAIAAGTYILYVSNPDGGVALRVNGITFSASPSWQTDSSLGEIYDGVVINLGLVATEATSYAVTAGSLPPGLTLNANTGVITGTVTGVTVDTTYNFTVTATDPQNQDSPRAFSVTVTVSDTYFKLTSLLLSGSAISANTVVRDSSTNNFNLTVYGDARASNFTPYGTGWSVYFDGTGDYLTAADSTSFDLGATDWTIELWANFNSVSGEKGLVTHFAAGTPNAGYTLRLSTSNSPSGLRFVCSGSSEVVLQAAWTPVVGVWYHIAAVRNSGTLYLYVNGVQIGSTSIAITIGDPSALFAVGTTQTVSSSDMNGYISNVRVVKGTALYTANFTPATTNLTSVANTSLLTCNANRFLDGSTNNFTINRNGDARVVSFNPFNITNTGVNGSMYFDGTGDTVSIPANTALAMGTGDFTWEFWIYPTVLAQSFIYGYRSGGAGGPQIQFTTTNTYFCTDAADYITVSGTPTLFSWTHFVLVRAGSGTNNTSMYWNGVLKGQATNTLDFNSTGPYYIGSANNTSYFFTGYIANARIIKGTAVYTGAFTPPTSPLTAIANTQLLTLQYDQPHNNHTFLDSSSNQFLITRSGNATQGTFSPFSLTGWAAVFDGNGDYLTIGDNAAFDFGTGDVTWECWIYMTGGDSSASTIFSTLNNGVTTNGYSFHVGNNTSLILHRQTTADGGNNTYVIINYTFTKFVWYHVAYVRNSGVNAMYVNGIAQSLSTNTFTSGYPLNSDFTMLIGGNANTSYRNWFSGYISNLRLLKGTALYTANFTPSTSTLTTIANTSLLTCHVGAFRDSSTNNFSIGVNGDVRVSTPGPFPTTAVYSPVTHGGSAYFDGSGDGLTVQADSRLDLTSDFTIEFYIYLLSNTGYVCNGTQGGSGTWRVAVFTNGSINFSMAIGSWAGVDYTTTTGWFTINQWVHIAITRNGSNFTTYINGANRGTQSNSGSLINTGRVTQIGYYTESVGTTYSNIYLSMLKIIKGTAFYTANFTPPTAPVTSTANTQLLLNFTDAAILDSTGRTVLETVADAKSSSVVTKFTGGSMSFDGTGDYLQSSAPLSELAFLHNGTPWTIDGWFYTGSTSQQTILSTNAATATIGMTIDINGTTTRDLTCVIYRGVSGSYHATVSSGSVWSLSTWTYFAVVLDASKNLTVYINGSQVATTSASSFSFSSSNPTYPLVIGRYQASTPGGYFNGYISDLRITRGYARYTANFTAPTGPARLK